VPTVRRPEGVQLNPHRGNLRYTAIGETMEGYEKVIVYGVSFDVSSKQPIVLLKVEDQNRFLPIWIGQPEAASILMKLQNTDLPRPMTHDLFVSVLTGLSASVSSVRVTELRENTFYAVLQLEIEGGGELQVDSRPSDAIALAVRTDAPIFAARDLLDSNAIEFEQEVEEIEDIVNEFREFLDRVSPEDF
jgi:uncharacterized protein